MVMMMVVMGIAAIIPMMMVVMVVAVISVRRRIRCIINLRNLDLARGLRWLCLRGVVGLQQCGSIWDWREQIGIRGRLQRL